jgi:hypothetical protein
LRITGPNCQPFGHAEPDLAKHQLPIFRGNTTMSDFDNEAVVCADGFTDPVMFFAAFTWRGWIARA